MTDCTYRVMLAGVQTVLGAVTGAVIYALWNFRLSDLGWEFPLWLIMVSVMSIPVAFVGVAFAHLAFVLRGRWQQPILMLACIAGILVSIHSFEFYMTELFPAINWKRGVLLPATSFLSGFILAWLNGRISGRGLNRWVSRLRPHGRSLS